MIGNLVHFVLYLIGIGCILGLLLYLVSIAPIPEPYKGWLSFVVLAVAIVILIYIILSLIGDHVPSLKLRGSLAIPGLTVPGFG